jgi:hypothetical protein
MSNNLSRKHSKMIKGQCHSSDISLGPVQSVYASKGKSGPPVPMADFLKGGPKPLRNFERSEFRPCNHPAPATAGSKKRSVRRHRRRQNKYTRRH